MSQTPVSIQGAWVNPDGAMPAGTVQFTPSAPTVNGTQEVSGSPVSGQLVNGALLAQTGYDLQIFANDDEATIPAGTFYTVSVRISGAPIVEFEVVVSESSTAVDAGAQITSGSESVTLVDLIASTAMVGQSISGSGIPGGATVTAVTPGSQVITISVPATGNGTTSATIGGVITFAQLQADAQ